MTDLNEPDPTLNESPREQEPLAEIVRLLLADSVEAFDRIPFIRKVHRFRGRKLHSRSQLVGLRARRDRAVDRVFLAKLPVENVQRAHLPLAFRGAHSPG